MHIDFCFFAVLFFILRLLKNADFQPRIALITRTLSLALTDLIHFVLLFLSITVGYSIVGVLLFGHQYDGFVNIQDVMISLIVMLIQWDPYQWIQVHVITASKSPSKKTKD